MKTQNKFEQLVEFIINEDEAKAKALFHKIVVEKSRDIYESLEEESRFSVQKGQGANSLTDEIEDHNNTIDGDMEGMHESDDEFGDDNEVVDGDDEFGDDDEVVNGDDEVVDGGEEELEDRVVDLEDAIDELKAEFDQLMAGEEAEEEKFPGIHDEESDLDAEEGDDEDFSAEEGDDDEESASVYENKKAIARKTPADLMREYVEKVTAVKPVEGDAVGASSEKVAVNKKSSQISGKNDMGGSSANIARGGAENAPDGTSPKKASNYGTKGEGKLPGADGFENRPGAKAGSTFKKATKPASKEGAPVGNKNTMGGSVSDKSVEPGGKSGFRG